MGEDGSREASPSAWSDLRGVEPLDLARPGGGRGPSGDHGARAGLRQVDAVHTLGNAVHTLGNEGQPVWAGQGAAATAASTSPAPTRVESLAEEVASAITHGLGLSAAVVAVLWAAVGHRFASGVGSYLFWVYGGSLWVLYLCSTLYHSLTRTSARPVLKVLDHSAIYVLIAGTYTPIVPAIASGLTSRVVLAFVWTCAIVGVSLSAVCHRHQTRLVKGLELGAYIGLGWLALGLLGNFWRFGHPWFVAFLVAGGIAYSAGTYFYGRRSLRFSHSYWHIAVMAGSALHFAAILQL